MVNRFAERRVPIWPVVAVLALAVTLRVWVVARSEVAARDSIGFIKYALRLESEPFTEVLRNSEQPPGYPVAVWIASLPVRAFLGTTPHALAVSAQIASAFFGILIVLPMISLGTHLIDRRFGLVAAALFQCLPSWVRFTSDGLSESCFLFWVATSLWLFARRPMSVARWSDLLIAGTAAGLAFLTRPEGLELVFALGLILLVNRDMEPISCKNRAARSAALLLGFAICFAPFVAVTGRITNKPTGRFLLGDPAAEKSYFNAGTFVPAGYCPPLASWWQSGIDVDRNRVLWSVETLITETATSSRQIGLALAIAGLFAWRRYVRNGAAGSAVVLLPAIHSLVLIRMASAIGYLSERHTALIMLTGCYPAALGAILLAKRLARSKFNWCGRNRDQWLVAFVAIGIVSSLPSLYKPMHANRVGHRKAGEWLAVNAPGSAAIRDPFCWAQYYAGRDFHDESGPDPDDQFVILENNDNQHSRLPLIPECKAKAAAGIAVYHWPESAPLEKAQVVVYSWHR